MAKKFHYYSDFYALDDGNRKLPDIIRYFSMAFRPAGIWVTCLILTIVTSICGVLIVLKLDETSEVYSIGLAILTGLVASGVVSIVIQLVSNYQRNKQRIIVLNEYLYTVSMYETIIEWASHGDYERYDEGTRIDFFAEVITATPRIKAVAEVVLQVGSIIEDAVLHGKEYLTIKELQCATRAVDAADKLGSYAKEIIANHYIDNQQELYNILDCDFKDEIISFAAEVGIYNYDSNLIGIVCDYVLSNIETFGIDKNDADEDGYSFDLANRNLMIY